MQGVTGIAASTLLLKEIEEDEKDDDEREKRMKTITTILLIISVIGILSSIVLSSIYETTERGSKVDCFDKYGNKIIGAECISNESHLNQFGENMFIVMTLSICLALYSMLVIEGINI